MFETDSLRWKMEGNDSEGWKLVNAELSIIVFGTRKEAEFLLEVLQSVSHDIEYPTGYY